MKKYTVEQLNLKTIAELKRICKKLNLKYIGVFTKEYLISKIIRRQSGIKIINEDKFYNTDIPKLKANLEKTFELNICSIKHYN